MVYSSSWSDPRRYEYPPRRTHHQQPRSVTQQCCIRNLVHRQLREHATECSGNACMSSTHLRVHHSSQLAQEQLGDSWSQRCLRDSLSWREPLPTHPRTYSTTLTRTSIERGT